MAANQTEIQEKTEKELESLHTLFASLLESGIYASPEELVTKGRFDEFEVTLFASVLQFKNISAVEDRPVVVPVTELVQIEGPKLDRQVPATVESMLKPEEVDKLIGEIRRALEQKDFGLKASLVKNLAKILETNTFVICLELDDLELDDIDASFIAQLLSRNKCIQYVSLERNKIGDNGVIDIANSLQVNSIVDTLKLGGNLIGDGGAVALATLLKTNNTIRILGLDSNRINEGVVALGGGST